MAEVSMGDTDTNPMIPRKLICENRHRWWRGVRLNLQPGDTCPTCTQPLVEDDT